VVHFVIATVKSLDLSEFKVNKVGTGSAQYPPWTMQLLLIYCLRNGIFSSRGIERATYRDVSVRYLICDTHPDHDTLAKFRRENLAAVSSCFVKVLELARELKLLKIGTISVDETKLKANAGKKNNVRYDRSVELTKQLALEVEGLLKRAEGSDGGGSEDGQSLPEELCRLGKLKAKMEAAKKRIEARNLRRAEREDHRRPEKIQGHH